MSPKSLNELVFKEETIPTQTYDALPDYGSFAPPPQPGPYRFKLPTSLDRVWELFDTSIDGKVVERVNMILEQADSLLIVGSPGGQHNGDLLRTRISNAERNRGSGVWASDMDYLLRAFGETSRPERSQDFIARVLQHAGGEFNADIRFSYSCNPNRNIRVYDAVGELQEVDGTKGCEYRFYSGTGKSSAEKKIGYVSKLKAPEGHEAAGQMIYPNEITCHCGAVLRAFANLENFREAK